MSEIEVPHKPDRTIPIALAAFAVMATSPFALSWYLKERDLRLCDASIQTELKSPSSYKRIKVERAGSSQIYDIEFDASNSFGTPIRGSASCRVDGGRVASFYLRPEGQE